VICQACGIEAPTQHVEFSQVVGAVLVRFSGSIQGELCKRCIHRFFWKTTGTCLTLGWWSPVSLVITPWYIARNIRCYLRSLGLAPVAPGATVPELTDEALGRLSPHADEPCRRLDQGEDLVRVAHDVSRLAGVTPGQVVLYTQALADAAETEAPSGSG